MTLALPIKASDATRRIAFAWRHGSLAARVVLVAVVALLLLLTIAAWQGLHLQQRVDGLVTRAAQLQTAVASKSAGIQAALPPDVVQTLPDAPAVSQIMQTLQQAADKEGARVESLQADDHLPTATALGHLDLTLSIKAPYPSTLVVLQQVLERYPGATLKQIDLAQVTAAPGAVPAAPMGRLAASVPTTLSDTRVQLSFWRRPLGVERASVAAPSLLIAGGAHEATPVAAASASAALAAASGAPPSPGVR